MSESILIAEDQELARKNIKRFLEQNGYRVEEAATGSAAIQTINNADFGKKAYVTITRNGDLMTKVYLKAVLPSISYNGG